MPPIGKAGQKYQLPCLLRVGGKMKKLLLLLFAIPMLIVFFGCSEKDDNPVDVNVYGYKLDQFIIQSLVADSIDTDAPDTLEFRNLYAYEIVSGEDGFSPRQSSYAGYDLNWGQFKEGFLVPSDNFRTWFADPSLPGAFRVRNTGYFRMYRKIDVIAPDESSRMVELRGLPSYTISNWDGNDETAVKLSELLTGLAAYDSVSIICYDDYGVGKYYHQDDINDGYYLLETERTIFPTASLPNNQKKMKKVSYLRVHGAANVTHTNDSELAPQESADMIFTVPASLDGFEETELPDYSG
jgi:hypothetical protein